MPICLQLQDSSSVKCSVHMHTLSLGLPKPFPMMQEAEYAEMLKARLESGKSASTSASGTGEAGVDENSIFADLDLDGTLPYHSFLSRT